MGNRIKLVAGWLILSFLLMGLAQPAHSQSEGRTRYFPETGHSISGRFLSYWETHGGLAQQGLPLSDEIQEVSDIDGKTYTVQYFERAEFELHPENIEPYDVFLSLIGADYYRQNYLGHAPGEEPNKSEGSLFFPQTGKWLGEPFLSYWEAHGGLAQQGYPITDEFFESSRLDGNSYKVQYFERAEFEYHPENI